MRVVASIVLGVVLALSPAPARGQPSHDLSSYTLLAIDRISSRSLSIESGNIGVNSDEGALAVRGILIASQSEVAAKMTALFPGSSCNILFSDLVPTAGCGTKMPFQPPIANGVAGVRAACRYPVQFPSCGGTPILVTPGETRTINPGTYSDVSVRSRGSQAKGIVELRPGAYQFCSLRMGRNAEMRFQGASIVNITGPVSLNNSAVIGPDASATTLSPTDIQFFVNAQGRRIHFSRGSSVRANVCAPDSLLSVSEGSALEGTFVARFMRLRRGARTKTPPPLGTTTTSSSTTTSTTSTTAPPRCGDGKKNGSEECDGEDFGGATCPGSPGGAFPGGSPGGVFLVCNANCTIDFSNCTPREVCGDCADNNRDGLTDFEDPACCSGTQQFIMTLRRARLRPNGGLSRLRLKGILARAGLQTVDPTKQDVFLQIRQPGSGELLCARIPAGSFVRKKRAFLFKDIGGTVAQGLQRVSVRIKRNGIVRLRASSKRAQFLRPNVGSLQVTVGFRDAATAELGNRCSVTTQSFRKGKKGAVRFP